MENVKRRRGMRLLWKAAYMFWCVIMGAFILGPGGGVAYLVYTKIHLINPSYIDAGVGEKLFAAIMLGGVLTVFVIMMAHWRGE